MVVVTKIHILGTYGDDVETRLLCEIWVALTICTLVLR